MNNRFIKTIPLIAGSAIFVSGCGDNSSFETPNTSETPTNNNLISQNNFTILFSPVNPDFLDPETGALKAVTSEVSVQIGDNNNQLITGAHTIFFRTEWGLIDPSCVTEDGGCSVTWRSGSPDTMPADLINTIIAYSHNGHETFIDTNGNGQFDDVDSFNDLDEPYIDLANNNVFDTGDIIIDTINGLDLTGTDNSHNIADGLYNGPNCSHSSLCSTNRATSTVWEDGVQLLNGGSVFSVGGAVSGLTGTVVIQNNLANNITITADGTYSYTILAGLSYSITVKTQPAGQTCTVANASALPTADVTNVNITCS